MCVLCMRIVRCCFEMVFRNVLEMSFEGLGLEVLNLILSGSA